MWAQTCIILQNEFDVLDLVIRSVQLKVFPDRWTKTQILQKRKTCLPLTPVLMIVSRPLDKSLINLSTESRPASTSMMSALGLVYLFESTELMKAVRFCSCQSTNRGAEENSDHSLRGRFHLLVTFRTKFLRPPAGRMLLFVTRA